MTTAVFPQGPNVLPPKPESKKYGPFRVLVGMHIEDDPDGGQVNGKVKDKVYTPASGPFYSSSNLMTLNGAQVAPKFAMVMQAGATPVASPFEKMPGETQEQFELRMRQLAADATKLGTPSISNANTIATLEGMNVKELQQWAAEEEIDLKGAKTKEEMLKIAKSYVEKGM